MVKTPPMHRYLQKFIPEEGSLGADEKSPLTFTQPDVEDGNILYVRTAPNQEQDCFSLNVMNGFQVVSRVEILVDIVPKWILLQVQNFTVQEGGSRALLEDYLKIPSKYFEGLGCEFVLLEPPKHSDVKSSNFPRGKLMKFIRKQVITLSLCNWECWLKTACSRSTLTGHDLEFLCPQNSKEILIAPVYEWAQLSLETLHELFTSCQKHL
ncbi:PREDICTED: chondroitin sulfate proteoglycan 4-like [Colobus angolensis palliatus]|uniref:chondroitin sulfate proteoglycan 4-like n=1 Tax=Colobus angolensis palliatus TaxID=336983 RepID=UPI0005F378D3|nr:PREDICTED: chondroitin sulfate proteoglycan 4-like [Colobus angolensis palliatus]